MSRNTPTNPGPNRNSMSTPLGQPLISTTSPTPSPRRHALGIAHLPPSPHLSRIVPQRMPSGSSDRDGSPGFGSPRRQTLVVSGFSPGTTSPQLPSVAEDSTADYRRITPANRQFATPAEHILSSGYVGSPVRSPRGLIPDLPVGSRRNSSGSPALVSVSIKSSSRSGTPRTRNLRLPSSRDNSRQATSNRTSRTVTPRDGSDQDSGLRSILVQMGSGTAKRQDSWTPDFNVDDDDGSGDDWAPTGGILLHDDDEDMNRSWTSLDAEEEANNSIDFIPGQRFGEGLKYHGETIVPAPARLHGHEDDHPLRRDGSEMGIIGRNGPSNVSLKDGKERQKKEYEIIRVAGSGSFATVYKTREVGGKRREYALKVIAQPRLSESQVRDQLHEATMHSSLPIHDNIVTLHDTLQTKKHIFLLLEWCPGDDLFYWLEKHKPGRNTTQQAGSSAESAAHSNHMLSSSNYYATSMVPFSPGAMYHGLAAQHPMAASLQSAGSPYTQFGQGGSSPYTNFAQTGPLPYGTSPHYANLTPHSSSPFHSAQPVNSSHYGSSPFYSPNTGTSLYNNCDASTRAHGVSPAAPMLFRQQYQPQSQFGQTPPTPTLLSAHRAPDILLADRLKLIASMFSQMCEAVAICHDNGVSHRDIKPENFICCDSVEFEDKEEHKKRLTLLGDDAAPGDLDGQSRRRVVVKLTDFGLATRELESLDQKCGSRPYMSYECCDGDSAPSYRPPPADIWSLGVVLLNMIFHRTCWGEPDPKIDTQFAQYLGDRRGYLLTRFPGIGNTVATFLADSVLCPEPENRVSARDFGRWIRNLPEMIAGRAAVKELRAAMKEAPGGMFAKSPIVRQGSRKTKTSTSALTTSAPTVNAYPGLSSLPPPSHLAVKESVPDSQNVTVPIDPPTLAEPLNSNEASDAEAGTAPKGDELPENGGQVSQRKKKRGMRRKGKVQGPLIPDRPADANPEETLVDLANASQMLARDLSKTHIARVDTQSPEHFPPLGTSDAEIAESKAAQADRSKWWREKLSFSSTSHNPQLAAFAKRIAEREAGGPDVKGGFGNWSAPAKMQDDHRVLLASPQRPGMKQTNTMSTSGIASQMSSFGGVMSSATSSGIEEEEPEEVKEAEEEIKAKETEDARAHRAIQAATALSSNLGSMGTFGQRPQHVPRHGPLHGKNMAKTSAPRAPVPIDPPAKIEKVVPKPKPTPLFASPQSIHSIQEASILTPPSAGSTKSPTSAPSRSAVPSLTHDSSNPSSATPSAPSASGSIPPIPPAPVERPGKSNKRAQLLGSILRSVNLSNKKD